MKKVFALFLVVLFVFAGSVLVSSEEPKEITFWLGGSTDDQQLLLEEHMFGPFEEEHNVKFVVTYDTNYDQNLRSATLAGAGPDIYYTAGPGYVQDFAKEGYLLSLDDYAKQYGWKDIVLPAFWDLSVIDGHLYSIPQNYETMEILYNARLFKEHGWTDPKTIETIDELFALSEQIKKDGFEPHTAGNSSWRGTNEWFVTIWLDNVAGVDNVHKALTGELPWTAEPFQEAITSLKNYFQNYFNKSYYAISGDDARYALVEGRSPMYFAGTWEFGILKQFAAEIGVDEWDWAPFPNKFADRYPIFSLGVGGTFSINKDSKVADECAEFLNYLLSDKSLNRRMAEVWPGEWNFPVNIMTQEDYGDNIDKRFSNHLSVASKALDTGRFGYTTWTFYPQATMVYIIEGIEQVWSDQITVEQYLERVNEIFQEEFAEGKVPVAPKPTL